MATVIDTELEWVTRIKKHWFDAILGDSQSRFVASMPLSYGVSCSVIQQSGVLSRSF